jgi:hypothetical protein
MRIEDYETDELAEELELRGISVELNEIVKKSLELIYEKRKSKQDYTEDLDQLIWNTIGRM